MTNGLLIGRFNSYNRSMRIGIDSRLPYYQSGGISKYVQHLILALAEIDHQNEYVIFHQRKDDESYVPPKASNFRAAKLWTPCHHKFERWSLGTELLAQNIDLLHSPDFIPPAFGAKHRVITIHDLNFVYYPEFLTPESRRYYLDQIAWAVSAADHISADSEHTRMDLINLLHVPEEKVTTIYLAADPVFSRNNSEKSIRSTLVHLQLPAEYILFVGTISPRKNLSNLIELYNQLIADGDFNIPLVIVGAKGWLYEDVFKRIEEYQLERNVYHIEDADDVQLAHLYSAANMLVLPSYYEGFGFPILEAMHCGCPVIASNRGSLPEVAGDAGVLLDPEDRDTWLDSISNLLTDTEMRNRMIEAGYRQVEHFSWKITARRTLSIYESLNE